MGRRRLGQAKGAVLALLHQAYRRRDQVAGKAAWLSARLP
jgi:Mg-chelatase subunit ChlD